jgi:hypothetical protein
MADGKTAKFPVADIESALEQLSAVGNYRIIMEMLHKVDVSQDEDFQRRYNGFYKLRRDETFRNVYYKYMQENKKNEKLDFATVLRHFYKEFSNVEASFSAKLLHTIRPYDLPTWDDFIGKNTKVEIPKGGAKEQRITATVEKYDELTKWFNDYRNSENGRKMLSLFDQSFPSFDISDIKKIDLVLWQIRHTENQTDP